MNSPQVVAKPGFFASFGRFVRNTIILIAIAVAGYLVIINWSIVFSKTYEGIVVDVQRVSGMNIAILNQPNATTLFSYAVMLGVQDGGETKYITSSSEDRQFAVVRRGQCARIQFFPYPPWEFEKGATYFNARLKSVVPCPPGLDRLLPPATAPESAAPSDSAAPASTPPTGP